MLMGLILHKGSSTNSGHYISIVKVGDIWFECDDVKITKIEFNSSCSSNTIYIYIYIILRKKHMMEIFKGHWVGPNGCRLLSELKGTKTPFSTGSSWRPLFVHWPLSPTASSVSWCQSSFVCSGLPYQIYRGVIPLMYVYCVVCYRVIEVSYLEVLLCLCTPLHCRWHFGMPNGLWAIFTP